MSALYRGLHVLFTALRWLTRVAIDFLEHLLPHRWWPGVAGIIALLTLWFTIYPPTKQDGAPQSKSANPPIEVSGTFDALEATGGKNRVRSITWPSGFYVWEEYDTYKIDDFDSGLGSFSGMVRESKQETYWYIQIISQNIEILDERKYRLTFRAKSNKDFLLYSRLGERNWSDGNSFTNEYFSISGDGRFHSYSLDFVGKNISNTLYFQVGEAAPGTQFEVTRILVQSID